MNQLFREAVTAYLRDHGMTGTLSDNGALTVDRPLTVAVRHELSLLASELGETLTIVETGR